MANSAPQVVVIDDSPASISLYARSTGPLSVELTTFESPARGLDYLQHHEADLVFLGNLMREHDGISVLKKIRKLERHEQTSVVIVSSKDYAQDRALAKELGALDYLVKPLRSQEIREIIRQYTDAEPVNTDTSA